MAADLKVKSVSNMTLKRQLSPNTTRSLQRKITPSTRSLVTSQNYVIDGANNRKNLVRKIGIILVAILFGLYGIAIITYVQIHFSQSKEFCESVVVDAGNFGIGANVSNATLVMDDDFERRLEEHPELLLWDYCKYQVYPFNDYPCQCRQFETPEWDEFIWSVEELRKYFNIELAQLLTNILTEWYMLEKLRWEDIDILYAPESPPAINITSEMFNTRRMRVISITQTPINYFDPAVSNWELLQYFNFWMNINLYELPDSMRELENLKYFSFGGDFHILKFPNFTCDLPQLETLKMDETGILGLPQCILELSKLRSILMTSNAFMQYFPLEIINSKSIQEFAAPLTAINWQSLLEYNGITNIDEFEKTFDPNPDASYWFDESFLCDDIDNVTSSKFYQWMIDSKCCETGCDFEEGFVLNSLACKSYEWQNGVCDPECENTFCSWDGGDCTQLCDYEQCDQTRLGNGLCDLPCNNEGCKYDFGDCETVVDGNWTIDGCKLSYQSGYHQCRAEWVGDGWCDSYCQDVSFCGYDENDCDGCENNQCTVPYKFMEFGGNSITRDDHISTEELCKIWDVAISSGLIDVVINANPEWRNCSLVIPSADYNGDNLANLHEMIIALHGLWNISIAKATQLNCSSCVGVFNYYN